MPSTASTIRRTCPSCRAVNVGLSSHCLICQSLLRPLSTPPPAARQTSRPIPVTPTRMSHLARALRHAQEAEHVSPDLHRSMHSRFMASDADGKEWTVALKTLKWHRRGDGGWAAADPPDALMIDGDLFAALVALPEPPPEKKVSEAAAKPEKRDVRSSEKSDMRTAEAEKSDVKVALPRTPDEAETSRVSVKEMERLARTLRAARSDLTPALFVSMHARFQATDERGNAWTVGLQKLTWHRKSGGSWVSGSPPETLYVAADLHRALRDLPGAEPSPACPHCGGALPKPDAPFCAHCGQRIGRSHQNQRQAKASEPAKAEARPRHHEHRRPETPLEARPQLCGACGAPIRPGLQHCTKCGTPVRASAAESTCSNPRCGKPIPPGKTFCPACGQRAH